MTLDLIIATYNRAELLRKCLMSVQAASLPGALTVRVLVVDNNSTDHTAKIVSSFGGAAAFPVDYLFVARQGKSAALNEAISQTHGHLVGLIDDDEQMDPGWFRVVEREFTGEPALAFIGGAYLPDWEQPAPAWLPTNYRGAIGLVQVARREPFSAATGNILMGGNAVIRRSVLKQVLPYPEDLGKIGAKIRSGEDEVIYHRLLSIGARGLQIPDMVIFHWIPAQRLTKRYFRRWVLGRGIAMGWQLRERGFPETAFLGIPRYLFGRVLRSFPATLTGRSASQRFTAQLTVLDGLATLYGRHSK